jgi:hypothetical protein
LSSLLTREGRGPVAPPPDDKEPRP